VINFEGFKIHKNFYSSRFPYKIKTITLRTTSFSGVPDTLLTAIGFKSSKKS